MAAAVLLVGVAVCVAVLAAGVDGHSTSEVTAAPSVGEMLLHLDQKLDSVRDAIQSSCGAGGNGGSDQEASANKLLLEAMQVKLAAMEKNQEALEKNQEAMEKQQGEMEADLASTKLTNTALQAKLTAMEKNQEAMEKNQEAMETDLDATNRALRSAQTLISSRMKSGSTFVRWGRKTCTNDSQVVYTGVAGGSHYTHSGAAVNLLCLTLAPQTDGTPVPLYYAYLYGAEYERIAGHHNQDVPCSVCLAAHSSTIMVPGTLTCPGGWTVQYTGHLVAGHYSISAATEYNCLDGHPENRIHGHENKDGRLLYHVITQCGSLPCPPYANGKVVTCVVCSK